jgi:hypothetical protein
MEKKKLELIVGVILIIILSSLTSIYALGYFDSDGDGVIDKHDPFPNDPLKSKDSDGDGVDDIMDAFPNDPSEQYDSDGDKVGNNKDAFPSNPRESIDSDGDGIGDNSDAFPYDIAASLDSDNDGYPDSWNEEWNQSSGITNLTLDEFPSNPQENTDSDTDGFGDNRDKFPFDPSASIDTDDDGFPNQWNEGMNQSDSNTNLTLDEFPYDPNEHYDSDEDGIGDNSDYYPFNPLSWRDPFTVPSEIVFDRFINLEEISIGKGITYDGTFYYILNYDDVYSRRKVFQFNSDFLYTGLSWNYTDQIEFPTGITYHDDYIYIIGNKYSGMYGVQNYLFKYSKYGDLLDTINISSYIGFAESITTSNNYFYICDSEPSRESIHIFNASTFLHLISINISYFPSDIIVHKIGNWLLINDQSSDLFRLYLYDDDVNNQYWNVEFNQKRIELVEDFLISISRNVLYIYKLY